MENQLTCHGELPWKYLGTKLPYCGDESDFCSPNINDDLCMFPISDEWYMWNVLS